MIPGMRNCRVLIHLDNFASNITSIRDFTGDGPAICLAVKADGYGHGAVKIARAAIANGVEFLAVASVDEGAELRAAGITAPILLLGIVPPQDIQRAVDGRMSAVVTGEAQIGQFAEAARLADIPARLHLKIDTGMGRIGCTEEAAAELALLISNLDSVRLEGVCTHFPVADTNDRTYTIGQTRRFERCVQLIREEGTNPGIIHAANSAALEGYPETWFDMVRPGIAAYGYAQAHSRAINLKPVMELRSRIVFIKKVPKGTPLSYGHTYATGKETTIATVSVGYADGYLRAFSNSAEVLIKGYRCPVVGTVCMDQLLVDIGNHTDIELYDEVTLFGPEGPDAADLAALAGTIPYEITCGVSSRIPRVYLPCSPHSDMR